MTLRKTSGISWTCQSTTNYLKGATIVIQNIEKLANMSKIDVVSQTSVYCVAEISSCLVTCSLSWEMFVSTEFPMSYVISSFTFNSMINKIN